MERVLQRYALSILSALLYLTSVAILPLGSVANAAPPTICPTGEGGPSCDLAISAPQSVAAGQPFTVTVTITDDEGTPVPPNDPCGKKVVVTLEVFTFSEEPFATYTANANKGVATFTVGGLPPGGEGPYFAALSATAEQATGACNYFSSDFVNVQVVNVAAGQPIFPCPPDESCTQVTNNDAGGGSAATLFAQTGSFSASFVPFDPDQDGACGITPADPIDPVLLFSYTGSSTKTVVFALSPDLITNGIGRYNVCWTSNTPFVPLGGGPPVMTGLLPKCSPQTSPPCVLFQTSTQHNGGFFGVSAPATDPRGFVGGGGG
jgi:hypothetical protein